MNKRPFIYEESTYQSTVEKDLRLTAFSLIILSSQQSKDKHIYVYARIENLLELENHGSLGSRASLISIDSLHVLRELLLL